MSIKNLKKTMKNSNGFVTLFLNGDIVFCLNEWYTIKYHKNGIYINNTDYERGGFYIKYDIIKRVKRERGILFEPI